MTLLTVADHRRDLAGLRYVYPVVSRRAGGISIGINLNPNNACNWACIYCQVPNLSRGGPPPLDLMRLDHEFRSIIAQIGAGHFHTAAADQPQAKIVDIAFSGNGEPTTAPEFAAAVAHIITLQHELALNPEIKLRLITNGSQMHRHSTIAGLTALGQVNGEVWFKIDRAGSAASLAINGQRRPKQRVVADFEKCAALAATWVQTCWFAIDGQAPSTQEEDDYLALIRQCSTMTKGVLLYGLARPSLQTAAPRLSALPPQALAAFGARIAQLGIQVAISP